eukprot:1059954-Pelagomonas_calceolata.AAC.1
MQRARVEGKKGSSLNELCLGKMRAQPQVEAASWLCHAASLAAGGGAAAVQACERLHWLHPCGCCCVGTQGRGWGA